MYSKSPANCAGSRSFNERTPRSRSFNVSVIPALFRRHGNWPPRRSKSLSECDPETRDGRAGRKQPGVSQGSGLASHSLPCVTQLERDGRGRILSFLGGVRLLTSTLPRASYDVTVVAVPKSESSRPEYEREIVSATLAGRGPVPSHSPPQWKSPV